MKIRHDVMASGNILIPKSTPKPGREKDTCELSYQKIRRPSGKSRTQERYKEQWDDVIGEELEFQHEHENAATLKIFHAFKFHCSMGTTNFFIG